MQSAELVIECVYPSSRLVVLVSRLMRSLRAQACKVVAAGREAPSLESVRKRSSRMLGTQVTRDTTRVLGVSSDRGSGVFVLHSFIEAECFGRRNAQIVPWVGRSLAEP